MTRALVAVAVAGPLAFAGGPAAASSHIKQTTQQSTVQQQKTAGQPVLQKATETKTLPAGVGPSNKADDIPGKGGKVIGGPSSGPQQHTVPGQKQAETKTQTPTEKLMDQVTKLKDKKQTDKGKELTADDFSREKQLRDLTDPKAGLKDTPSAAEKLLDGKSGGSLTPGRVTVEPGAGKNSVTKQQMQGGQKIADKNEFGGETWQAQKGSTTFTVKYDDKGVGRETQTINMTSGLVRTDRYDENGKPTGGTTRDQDGKLVYDKNDTKTSTTPEKPKQDDKQRPNPDAVTGETSPLKSPGQIEAERRRQVTLPNDDQSRQPDGRVYVKPETIREMAKDRQGDRINPADGRSGDGTTTAVGGIGSTTPRPGSGPEQIDRPRQGGGRGPGPDDPTSTTN